MVYDYYKYLKDFGFEWENIKLEFKYAITLSSDGKKLTKNDHEQQNRCLLFTEESRIWNMDMENNKGLSYIVGYIYYKNHIVNMLNIRGASRNLAVMTPHGKKKYFQGCLLNIFIS